MTYLLEHLQMIEKLYKSTKFWIWETLQMLCDVIKQNEAELTKTDFEIQA